MLIHTSYVPGNKRETSVMVKASNGLTLRHKYDTTLPLAKNHDNAAITLARMIGLKGQLNRFQSEDGYLYAHDGEETVHVLLD